MVAALRSVLFLLSFIVSQFSFATEYTFTGNGSWTNLANWKDGLYPGVAIRSGDIVNITGQAVMGICPTYPMPSCEDVYGRNLGTINIAVGGSLTLQNQNQYSSGGVLNIYGTLINKTQFEGWETQTIHVWGTIDNRWGMGNDGTITIYEGGTLKSSSLFSNHEIGKLILKSGGTISNESSGTMTLGPITNEGGSIRNVAKLQGNADITGSLQNYGTLAPGNSPGKYHISGDYTAIGTTIHSFEVGGISEDKYDVLKVDGTVNLNGTLNVSLIDGFSSTAPHQIPIITGTIKGTFSSLNLPGGYSLIYNENSVVLNRLPIQTVIFNSFTAEKDGANGKISWTVQNEADVFQYEVERSSMGSEYYKISTVPSTKSGTYSIGEVYPHSSAYFRIKCIYPDGVISYSQPVIKYHVTNINKFTGTGNWSDATKWTSGTVPTTLSPGQYLVIDGNCQFDLTSFNSDGVIEILQGRRLNFTKGDIRNTGNIIIWGTLENNADRFENLDSINLAGSIINNTVFVNTSAAIAMRSGSSFINNSTGAYSSGSLGMEYNSGFINYGAIGGNLTIGGNFLNEATLAPGNSPGTCTVRGNYTASASAKHNFEVDGLTAGSYDVLKVEGTANLSGAMNIILKPGVTIAGSTEIPIVTGTINGTFSSTSLPDGLMLDYRATSVVLKAVTPLPVLFVKLAARKQASGVQITWKVADEKGVLRYEVEKSTDGSKFSIIGMVQADGKEEYSFLDDMTRPIAYYRVKSIDADGKQGYSQTVFLKGEANNIILKAFIAASGSDIIVQHPTAVYGTEISIFSIEGRLLKVKSAEYGAQQTIINFPSRQSGIFVISYGTKQGSWQTTKLFKLQ